MWRLTFYSVGKTMTVDLRRRRLIFLFIVKDDKKNGYSWQKRTSLPIWKFASNLQDSRRRRGKRTVWNLDPNRAQGYMLYMYIRYVLWRVSEDLQPHPPSKAPAWKPKVYIWTSYLSFPFLFIFLSFICIQWLVHGWPVCKINVSIRRYIVMWLSAYPLF